jgi:hypothetical protein
MVGIGIITWIANKLGVSTLIVQIGLIVIVLGGAFWWLKVHDAKLYEKTYKEAKANGIEEQKKINIKEWNNVLDKIKAEKEEYVNTTNRLKILNEELTVARNNWERKYITAKTTVNTQIVEIPKIVEKIPKSELVDTIRVASGALVLPTPIINIEKTGVFTETEERLVLNQVMELGVRRSKVQSYELLIQEDKINDKSAEKLCNDTITAEKTNVGIVSKERDVALEKAKFFEESYDSCRKGRSKKCWFFKIITLGMAKCI